MTRTRACLLILLGVLGQAACTNDSTTAGRTSDTGRPLVVVHKTATCGCCSMWVEHLRANGFEVDVRDAANLTPVKDRTGVPSGLRTCHTAEVGGYFVEGHVPASEIARLLAERPDAKGLAVPGMPLGSPGMEYQNQHEAYDVLLVLPDGNTSVFAHHDQ